MNRRASADASSPAEPAAAPTSPSTPVGGHAADAATPLLIDLDHALIRNDLLMERVLAYVAPRPWRMLYVLLWMLQGRANLERKLAATAGPDPEFVPVDERVVELAHDAKHKGREVFLVTAGDELFAQRLAARFPFVDGVLSSDGGHRGVPAVSERFLSGYDYIGGSDGDLSIWRNAREVVAVDPGRSTLRKIERLGKPTTVFRGTPRLRALIESARLHQWVKNTLIFVPAVLSGTIANPATAIGCTIAFVALGLIALGTYLVNDLLDIDSDRRHWSKRLRPIAAGDLPIGLAAAAAVISIAAGLAIGAAMGARVLAGLMVYLALTLAYSAHLKRVPILDVTILATLFTLRITIGIAVASVFASPWLLVFSMALFASLSFAKRYTEIQRTAAKGERDVPGRGYITADAPLVLGLGLAAATTSVVILVLFLIFDALERDIYANPHWLWLFPVIIFLWVGRIWLICQRGELNDDPVVFAIKDRQSLILGALSAAAFGLALLGAPL